MRDANGGWRENKQLARAILSDRAVRRKVMSGMLAVALAQMIGGVWVVDGWLAGSPWVFLVWWSGCAFLVLMLMVFAVYDALAVLREERGKML